MMSSSKNHHTTDQQCTIHCSFDPHAEAISRAITVPIVADCEVAAYMNLICSNCGCITDMGRTPLHIAASVGRHTLAKWLIFKKSASVNAKDIESGYTPLHRSILYGQIHVAVSLMQLGGDLYAKDSEGLTPIDLAMKDRARQINSKDSKYTELYVWGSNCNYTLGTPAQTARNYPEPLDYFRKRSTSLKKVYMEKYHTVFQSTEGEVFACGHGRGGRLGVGSESAVMTPEPVVFDFNRLTPSSSKGNAWKRNICQDIAVGRDHTLFLMEDGLVYSCGLNKHRQLGIVPPQESALTPHPIHPKLFAPDFLPLGICAGRYHSIVWNAERVYFFGMNAGQFGTSRKNEKYYVEPKEDPYFEDKRQVRMKKVVTSTGTTVVLSTTHILTVINRFEHTKIFLGKFLEKERNCVGTVEKQRTCITSIAVTGGKLEPVDTTVEISQEHHPIVIAVLFDDGIIYLWQEQAEDLRRCVFNISRSLQIASFSLNTQKLFLVTHDGEVFESAIRLFKPKPVPVPLDPRSENVNVEAIYVKRIPYLHRAVFTVCDPTESNFATIQKGPLIEAIGHTHVPKRRMTLDMAKLLEEVDEMDTLHDVIFQVEKKRFPAHLYVIARSSIELLDMSMQCVGARGSGNGDSEPEVPVVEIDDVHPDLFYELLVFMYSNTCCLLEEGPCPVWRPKQSSLVCVSYESKSLLSEFKLDKNTAETGPEETMDPIKEAILVAKRFGLLALVEKLQQYKVEDGIIVKMSKNSKIQRVPVKWDRTSFSQFHDVRLKSIDGTIFPAHKCILIARLEYFNIMFLRGWREASSQEALALPLQRGVLEILLEFLYTDKISSLINHGRNERSDLAWDLLITADEFLMPRLKALAEQAIKELLTIQNVVQVLNMAIVYNAQKLKQSCLEFISFNMANLLELRSLEDLSEDLLLSVSKCYQKTMKLVDYRDLSWHSEAPSSAEIRSALQVQPPPWMSPDEFENISIDSAEYKKKPPGTRKRTRIRKSSENGTVKNLSETNCPLEFSDSLDKAQDESTLRKETEDVILDFIEPEERVENLDVFVGKENKNPAIETANSMVKASIPLPNPLFMQKFFSNDSINEKNGDYPELGQGDNLHSHNRQRTKSERSTSHRLTRLSQKQRKRLLSQGENPVPKEDVKQSHCPWEKSSFNIEEKEVSLRDIMEREALEARKTRKVTPACAIPSSKKAVGSQSPHSWSHVTSTGSSPSSFGQSFPKVGFASNSDRNLSLDEVIAEENKRKENFFRMKNKPLHLTQLEDKAIDDLMKFYNAHNSHFECITVKRVEYTLMAQPKWIAKPLILK